MKKLYTTLLAALLSLTAVAQSANDKFTVQRTDGSTTNYSLKAYDRITYKDNKQYIHKIGQESRIGTSIDNIESVTFDIYHASDVSDIKLADNAANDNAKQLYKYLRLNYGVKTLSSVIADVSWNNREAENIFAATGKYPAINCYDFIHIHVPDGNGWIDYSDITPVTTWSNAGGLVSLMWHFNVPYNETTTIQKNGSGGTVRPYETTFKAANALVSGTWENKWFYEQVDKVANVLLQLQNAGVAALWRPFHEAAGNATAKNGSGSAWFWWGADGADTFKALWQALFNRLREKGVHNLIYVWTSQNNNGNSSAYNNDADWYPGDDLVDIIARDLYGYTAAQNEQEYRELTARYPHKMITLAECGNNSSTGASFSEVVAFWNAGARWSWFMPWYGSSTMPSNSWWANAFNQSFVITRDQVRLDATYVEESAVSAVKNMRLAWNLGNTLDAFSTGVGNNKEPEKYETCWGQPVTKPELMAFLKREGFNAVRVPVTWWQHLDSNDNIDDSWMKRVQEIVDYVISQGMYCIINVHHDTGSGSADQHWLRADISKFDQMNVRFQKIWQQIATRFISYDQRLLFEGYNEMLDDANTWTDAKDASSYTAVNQFAQSFVNTVRATGGNNATRNLIVTPYSAATWNALTSFNVPTDNVSGHLIAEIHSYDPYDWLATAGTWGTTQSNFIRDMYTRLKSKFISQGVPVIIGECGIIGENDVDTDAIKAKKTEAAKHIADVIRQGKALNIPVFYWMTLIDGADRSVPQWTIPELVEAMKTAYYEYTGL